MAGQIIECDTVERIVHIAEKLIADYREVNAEKFKSFPPGTFVPNCLIVEDNADDALLAKRAVESIGAQAEVYTNGDDAIEALRRKKCAFHIVFIDLALAGSAKQGYDVLQYLLKNCPHVPPVIVSGHIDEGTIRFLAGDRYIGIVKKPLHEANLRDILRKHRLDPPDYEV